MWSEGSGLFDLNNLKAGDKSKLETMTNPQNNISVGPNLLTSGDDLNKIWASGSGGAPNTGFGNSTNSGAMGGFAMQNNQN